MSTGVSGACVTDYDARVQLPQVLRLGDPAAAFHLARQYEAMGRISEAIKFYTMAHRYSHGVRLAKVRSGKGWHSKQPMQVCSCSATVRNKNGC